jgi:preprotein translocase subunit SecG
MKMYAARLQAMKREPAKTAVVEQGGYVSGAGDVLTWATSIVFGVFLTLAVFLNLVANRIGSKAPAQQTTTTAQPPAQSPSQSPAPTR